MITTIVILGAVSVVMIVIGFALANRGEAKPEFAKITGGNVDYRLSRPALPPRARASTTDAIAARARRAKKFGEGE